MSTIPRDDHIYPITRWVLAVVNLALFFAFVILYIFPQTTRQNFAWEIKPLIMPVFMGAGYISGAYMFMFAIFGRQWHRVKNSILPVSAFAAVMLLVTLLHYDRFTHDNLPFALWLGIYIVTPFLVPWLWLHNRPTDPGAPEPGDKIVPAWIRGLFGVYGIVTLLFWTINFIFPSLLIGLWFWKLTPLTARTLCAWGLLLSVGGLVLFRERRWSAWRYNVQSIALWQALMVAGSILHRQDFTGGSLLNGYFIGIIILLVSLGLFYAWMEWAAPGQPAVTLPGSTS
ncbi:MAG TPA: hypothetical protein VF498_01155 [Anaerolineales bacterium]